MSEISVEGRSQLVATIREQMKKDSNNAAIVYNPQENWQVNIAANLAGIKNAVMVPSDAVALELGLRVVLDLNKQFSNLANLTPAEKLYWSYDWLLKQHWNDIDPSLIAIYSADDMFDLERDLAIMKKHLMIPYPGTSIEKSRCTGAPTTTDKDYSDQFRTLAKYVFQHFPANSPVIGWYQIAQAGRQDFYGVCEYDGVQHLGHFAKFTWGTSFANSLSFHSQQKPTRVLKQKSVGRKLLYNSAKKYVAVTMMESGDSIGYHQWGIHEYQWSDKSRGSVPVNYGITPALLTLMPKVAEYLYDTATPSDYFFSSVGGLGYMYAFDNYGIHGVRKWINGVSTVTHDQFDIIHDYFRKTGAALDKMDIKAFGLYSGTHADHWRNPSFDDYLRTFVTPHLKNQNALVSDMGRLTHMSGQHASRYLTGRTPIFHCLTRWYIPPAGSASDIDSRMIQSNPNLEERKAWDEALATWLANEIRGNAQGTKFIHAMAFSWHYGPTRIKLTADKLRAEGYEFVTIGELTDLFKQANP